MDLRIEKLAKTIVNYSCRIKKDEKVLIDCFGSSPLLLFKAIIREVYSAGGLPFATLKDNSIIREIIKNCTTEQLEIMKKIDLPEMKSMDAYIGIRAHDNVNELGDIPVEKISAYMKNYAELITDYRIKRTKWLVLRYPNNSMAQLANTSLEDFENFYFKVCNLDYNKMSTADNLVKRMNDTSMVRITERVLTFRFVKISLEKAGRHNCRRRSYTAPVKNSVNGFITFNIPQIEQGVT